MSISRRSFLPATSLGGLSYFGSSIWSSLFAAQSEMSKAKSCILIFLEGGPSQIDTFDPKPGAATAGSFEAIDTKLAGVKFAQHVPRLAELADKLAIVRSLTSMEGDHDRAQNLIHTGYRPNPRLQYPSLGSTVAWRQSDPEIDVPAFVSIGRKFDASGRLFRSTYEAPIDGTGRLQWTIRQTISFVAGKRSDSVDATC